MSSEDKFNSRCSQLLSDLYELGQDDSSADKISTILAELRIISREKTLRPQVIDAKCTDTLVKFSSHSHTEAQKCISNLILNYSSVRQNLVGPYVDCVDNRLQKLLDKDASCELPRDQLCEVLHYDMRILFLLSALCPTSRATMRNRLITYILQLLLLEGPKFEPQNSDLVLESLKTLFNLTLDGCQETDLVFKSMTALFKVVKTRPYDELTEKLLVNLIHLLTNMPGIIYEKLMDSDVNKILEYLDVKLHNYTTENARDTIMPVLNVCANICKHNERVRSRWFEDILGSTKDFSKRPEECDSMRGRLVKLMTSVDVHVKDIAAEFIYRLCKNDTGKLISYTGFGNSAAFLTSRGLMSGSCSIPCEPGRSDINRIDPITGKLETEKKNPMEGMSEEEKEYQANELAKAITKLSNLGVMRPAKVDEHGNVSDLKPREKQD